MLINKTRKKILVKKLKICKNIFKKSIGLMFSKKIKDVALVFPFKKEKITLLHMFFVFYQIDVLFLNEHKEVTELKENLRPFTFYRPRNKAKYIIELPAGKIGQTKTRVGDKIEILDIKKNNIFI